MKKIIFLGLLMCLCSSNLIAQHHIIDDKVYPECSNREIYSPVLWEKNNLYYYIDNVTTDISSSQCQTAIQNAFNTWAQYSRFTFTQTYNLSLADIKLSWEVGNHGSYCPSFYDRPAIAHSSYGKLNYVTPPCFIHFNDDYTFSTDGTQIDVESVTLHEIGHCLGLGDNYTNSSSAMYYNISSGTIRRSLTSYDLTALFNLYEFSIIGPKLISTEGVYYIDNLPTGLTVEWSLADTYYSQNCFQQNYPSQNQCKITRDSNHDMIYEELTATIKYNGVAVQTLTKSICAYAGFKGTYISSFGSGVFSAPNPILTEPNTYVHLLSPSFIGATYSYTGDATPTYWLPGYDMLDVGMPSTGNTILIHIYCANGEDYYLPIIKSNTPYYLSVGFDGDMMTITLDESISADQAWTLEIIDMANGEKVITRNVSGNCISLNTSGWKRGIYAVRATIGKEVLTEKVVVK